MKVQRTTTPPEKLLQRKLGCYVHRLILSQRETDNLWKLAKFFEENPPLSQPEPPLDTSTKIQQICPGCGGTMTEECLICDIPVCKSCNMVCECLTLICSSCESNGDGHSGTYCGTCGVEICHFDSINCEHCEGWECDKCRSNREFCPDDDCIMQLCKACIPVHKAFGDKSMDELIALSAQLKSKKRELPPLSENPKP